MQTNSGPFPYGRWLPRNRILLVLIAASLISATPPPATAAEIAPWWKQQKLRLMWGQWDMARADKTRPYTWIEILPRELFRNLAHAGGTVFVASREHRPENARFAHE